MANFVHVYRAVLLCGQAPCLLYCYIFTEIYIAKYTQQSYPNYVSFSTLVNYLLGLLGHPGHGGLVSEGANGRSGLGSLRGVTGEAAAV